MIEFKEEPHGLTHDNKIGNIRALAIFIVVLGHSIIIFDTSWGVYSSPYESIFLDELKRYINYIQMPLFVFVSGYCFHYSAGKPFAEFAVKKFRRLIVPLIAVGAFWMIPIRIIIHYNGFSWENYGYLLFNVLIYGRDNGHLWFLGSSFLMMIIFYFLSRVIRNNKIEEAVIGIVLLGISLASSHFPSMFAATYIRNMIKYFCWFYFGYVFHRYFSKKIIPIRYGFFWGILFVAIGMAAKGVRDYAFGEGLMEILVGVIGIMTIFILIPEKTNRFVEQIEKHSFGIYLFHSPLVYISYSKLNWLKPFPMTFLNLAGWGVCAYVITDLLKGTRLKWMIGE